MSRIKTWTGRIPLILQHLETDEQPVYTRIQVQKLFIIGRSQATDLMRVAGAVVKDGAETTVSRENLQFYVQRSPEAKVFLDELERRRQLAIKMRNTAEDLRARAVEIPGAQPADEWTRLRDLPNVDIAPGTLRIVFAGQPELVRTLWKLAKAMANEPDLFKRMCEGDAA